MNYQNIPLPLFHNLISGFLFIALGILILSGELTAINNIGANFAPIQKLQDWSMDIERWILSFSKDRDQGVSQLDI